MTNIENEGIGAQSLQWVSWADNDYLAARQLFLSDNLVQACSLANTSIEKYLKALFVIRGLKIPRGFQGHNICELYAQLKKDGTTLNINEEFLSLLFKSYKLRYPDDLEVGFNIALVKTQLLVECDHTVSEIRKGFQFKKGGKMVMTKLDDLIGKRDQKLLEKNCILGNANRRALFEEVCFCYELRVLDDGSIMEATYQSNGVRDDGKFDVVALKPGKS